MNRQRLGGPQKQLGARPVASGSRGRGSTLGDAGSDLCRPYIRCGGGPVSTCDRRGTNPRWSIAPKPTIPVAPRCIKNRGFLRSRVDKRIFILSDDKAVRVASRGGNALGCGPYRSWRRNRQAASPRGTRAQSAMERPVVPIEMKPGSSAGNPIPSNPMLRSKARAAKELKAATGLVS